jgi:hypothetical protein
VTEPRAGRTTDRRCVAFFTMGGSSDVNTLLVSVTPGEFDPEALAALVELLTLPTGALDDAGQPKIVLEVPSELLTRQGAGNVILFAWSRPLYLGSLANKCSGASEPPGGQEHGLACRDADVPTKEKGPAEAEPEPSRNQPAKIDKFENLTPEAGMRSEQFGGGKAGTDVKA